MLTPKPCLADRQIAQHDSNANGLQSAPEEADDLEDEAVENLRFGPRPEALRRSQGAAARQLPASAGTTSAVSSKCFQITMHACKLQPQAAESCEDCLQGQAKV